MRKWIYLSISLLFLLAALPFLASRPPFKKLLLAYIGAKHNATIEIDTLNLSWLGPQQFSKIHITTPDIDGTIEKLSSSVPLWSLSSMRRSFSLEGGAFQIQSPPATIENISAKISGTTIEASGLTREGAQTGEFKLQGNAVNPSLKDTDIDLTLLATRIPTLFIDRLLNANGILAASLGATFDCKAAAVLQNNRGTLKLNLSALNAEGVLDAAFTPTAFTLQKPLALSFRLTPALSQMLLRNANPLFLTGVQSKNFVTLLISEKNFSFPRPFQLEELHIEQAVLDMGQVRIENGPSLASLIGLLKSDRLTNLKQMNAWFTPLDFSLRKGLLATGRMDLLLADSIHLCTWGNINLIRDQIDMTLGLPAETLRSAFGLQNLPSTYMMKIPIQGSTQSPDIATGPAAAKIAALLATQNIPKKAGPFGSVLNLFTPAVLDDSGDVPPAKRPFPWER